MKLTKTSYFLLPVVLLIGCRISHEHNNTNRQTTVFKVEATHDSSISVSDLVDSVHYVILETNEESLIGTLEKIVLYKEDVFIMDDKSSLLRFNNKGKFIGKIGSVGEGPGEFHKMTDFSIYDDRAWVFDRWRILVYTLDGKLLEVLDMRFTQASALAKDNIEVTSAGIYVFNAYIPGWSKIHNRFVYLLNHKGNKILKGFEISHNPDFEYNDMMSSGLPFGRKGEDILFHKFFNDTVYHLNANGIKQKYAYSFGKQSLTYKERILLKKENTHMYDIKDKVQGVYKSFLTDKSILTCMFFNTKHLWHYKNFETNEEKTFTRIIDDLHCGANFFHFFETDGKLVSYIPTYLLHANRSLDPASKLGQLKAKTNRDDNQILAICTFK